MAKVKMIVEDDFGNEISSKSYDLGSSLTTLTKIETAISSVSGDILGNISADVLGLEQAKFSKKVDTKLTEPTS